MKIKAVNISILTFGIAAGLTLLATVGCHGRKVKAELLQFARTITETRAAYDSIVMEFEKLNSEQMNQPDALAPQIKDMTQRIDAMLAPVKAMNIHTEEVKSLRDNWLKAWESFRDALDIIYRVITTRDKNLALTMDEQLRSRMISYEQSIESFDEDYKLLLDKFNLTDQEIGNTTTVTPIAPMTPPTAVPQASPPITP